MTAPTGADDASAPERTPWQHAQQLLTEGNTPLQIAQALAQTGLDAESVRVLINALPGARMPQALPEANLDLSVNPLAPSHFSLFELGLRGDPRTIGLYWVAFGAVLAALLGLLTLVGALSEGSAVTDEIDENWQYATTVVLPRLGLALALAAITRGLYLWLTSVSIRRK